MEDQGQGRVVGLDGQALLAQVGLELVEGILAFLVPDQLSSMLLAEPGIERLGLGRVHGVVPRVVHEAAEGRPQQSHSGGNNHVADGFHLGHLGGETVGRHVVAEVGYHVGPHQTFLRVHLEIHLVQSPQHVVHIGDVLLRRGGVDQDVINVAAGTA